MKLIKRIITTFIVVTILGALSAQVFIYTTLFREIENLRGFINQARELSHDALHKRACLDLDPNISYILEGYQLRFTSDKDYLVEAVCVGDNQKTIEINSSKLSYGVTKIPGYSGMYFPIRKPDDSKPLSSNIVLEFFWLQRAISFHDQSLASFATDDVTKPDSGESIAQTTCQAWGFMCCDARNQVGFDHHQKLGVTDCQENCYETCNSKPVILFFNSDPRLLAETRQVSIKQNQLLLLSYSVQDPDGEPISVTVDFGDGQTTSSTNSTDSVSHSYSCPSSSCTYQATLTVTDSNDLTNADTRLSSITVIVSR